MVVFDVICIQMFYGPKEYFKEAVLAERLVLHGPSLTMQPYILVHVCEHMWTLEQYYDSINIL